jgi:diguanylate cyclase (GGDEF)-like protein
MDQHLKEPVRVPFTGDLDRVTLLPPRQVLDMHLPVMLSHLGAMHLPLAAIIIDVDHFKKFNDSWGHPIGDEVLKHVSGIIRSAVYSRGEAYRYGGEEIVVLLHNADLAEGHAMAERLVKAVRESVISLPPDDPRLPRAGTGAGRTEAVHLSVTISAGVCSTEEVRGAELIVLADQALLKAKAEGRNRAVRYEKRISTEMVPQVIDVRYPDPIEIAVNSTVIIKAWFPLADAQSIEARNILIEDSKTHMIKETAVFGGAIYSEIPGRVISVEKRRDQTFFDLEVKADVLEVMVKKATEWKIHLETELKPSPGPVRRPGAQ